MVGELVPKALALQRTEPVALWTAFPFQIFYLVTWPFTWALNNSANLVLKILRLPPPTEAEMVHSPDELRLVLQHVQLDPGAAASHRSRLRLHAPGRPARHDLAA